MLIMTPAFVFQTDRPTVIEYDDHEYLFEGFSLFSHTPLTNVSLLCLGGGRMFDNMQLAVCPLLMPGS